VTKTTKVLGYFQVIDRGVGYIHLRQLLKKINLKKKQKNKVHVTA
jgi:hypothetical protein